MQTPAGLDAPHKAFAVSPQGTVPGSGVKSCVMQQAEEGVEC